MKGSKVFNKLKSYKAVGITIGILMAIAILGGLASAFALLLMLLWNVVMVTALANAVPVTFWTVLIGVAILYGIFTLANIIRGAIQGYMQMAQMKVAMNTVRKFDDDAQAVKEDILHKYFHTN